MNSTSKPSTPMHPDTVKALKESIQHWQNIVDGKDGTQGSGNCALCARFLTSRDQYTACVRSDDEVCPVYLKTDHDFCCKTPFTDFVEAGDLITRTTNSGKITRSFFVNGPESLAAAKAEVAFLKSLLPEGEK